MKPIKTYGEFWPYYLQEHSQTKTRILHAMGVVLGVLWALIAFLDHRPLHIPLGLVIGYGFAWAGHLLFEKNQPTTLKYPLWSFVSDLRMTYLILSKKLPLR